MLDQVRFADHEGFQRTAAYWALAGAGGALLGLFARSTFGLELYAWPVMLVSMGAGVGAAAGFLRQSAGRAAVGAALGALFAFLAVLLSGLPALGPAAPLVGAATAGAALGLCWGPEQAPPPARAVGFSIASVLGFFVISTFLVGPGGIEALKLPGVQDAAAGALMGFFLSLGGAVGRLHLARDPIHQLYMDHKAAIKGDLAALVEQGVQLYDETLARAAKLREKGQAQEILGEAERVAGEATSRIILLAARWGEIEQSVDDTARPRLEARLKALEEKLGSVKDPVIIAEYGATARTIRDQLAGFGRIDVARERLVARMHRLVASLERVCLNLLQISTSDAQDASLHLQPELERLDEMSDELSWKTLSVDDLVQLDVAQAAPLAQEAQREEAPQEELTEALTEAR